ncbi:MAG: class II fumarate hydratase [Gammaproteobacteria bacterium]
MSKSEDPGQGKTRLESDSLGEIEVPDNSLWGAQTQRARQNFNFESDRFPARFVSSFALVKKAAAISNGELGQLEKSQVDLIVQTCDEILQGKHSDQFPLPVWQSGSGTQTHMNVNEVIANRCNELAGHGRGSKTPIHPNDHVNKGQSTNDVFPTVMHLCTCQALQEDLYPAIKRLLNHLEQKVEEFDAIIKTGRTHMMDATPITLGQEFSAFHSQVEDCLQNLEHAELPLRKLAIGGTAVGTGLNTESGWAEAVCKNISELSALEFSSADNKFSQIAAHDALVQLHGTINGYACSLLKIVNDLRLMASGPRCGLHEIYIPANEPGSSIMPGKVNPTQIESVSMICLRVMGNNLTVSLAGSQGQFQLNAYKPVIIHTVLESIQLLANASENFTASCLAGIKPNREQLNTYLNQSLMLVTALNPEIGYDKASKVAHYAYENDTTLRSAVIELGFMSGERFDQLVDPAEMLGHDKKPD